MLLMLLAACGQFVPAGETLGGGTVDAQIDLASRDELAAATSLQHYGQIGLLAVHTADEQWNGGAVRSVAYSDMLASVEAQVTIADSLANLAAVDPLLLDGHEEKLAFWINLYNLWIVQAAADALGDDPDWTGASNEDFVLFNTNFITVGGVSLTPNQLEQAVIRGDAWSLENYFIDDPDLRATAEQWHDDLWQGEPVDARIHMGLNCASRSCPDLLDGAFRADTINDDLDALAERFVSHPGKGAGPDGISFIFSWYATDFDGSFGSVEDFVATYRDDADVDYGAYLEYDWSLNGQ